MIMRQRRLWLAAAIIAICGLGVLTSCSNEDDPVSSGVEYKGVPLVISGPTAAKEATPV